MKKVLFLFIIFAITVWSQIGTIIPVERTVDWRNPGISGGTPVTATRFLSVKNYGAKGDGVNDDTQPVKDALLEAENNRTGITVVYFPPGNYLITESLSIKSNIVLKGAGSDKTQLSFSHSPSIVPISFRGSAENNFISVFSGNIKGSRMIGLTQETNTIRPGDYIELIMNNGNWKQENTSSNNPQNYAGQIIKAEEVSSVYITLKDKLSISYEFSPRARRIYPVTNSGIEDLKIYRVSNGKGSGSNVIFDLAAGCWMKGVESDNAARYHMEISRSTEIEINGCYFHHAEDYGDGGYGYGIAVNMHSTNCLIENNIFQRLRHAMLLQLGANRNVFGYNYSREQHSTYIEPIGGNQITTTLGDLNLHAHFPYANLFEGNIVEAISADNYWGDNGPINTIFRNRVTRTDNMIQMGGIHIQANYQNIIGNVLEDITDQFYYTTQYSGNLTNYNGSPGSMGDAPCNDYSYYYEKCPDFLTGYTWPPVGTRTNFSTLTQKNPAYDRWNNSKKTVSALEIAKWNVSLETPQLISPANGASDCAADTKFIWQKIKGAEKYIFEISEKADFSSILYTDSTIVDTFVTLSVLSPNNLFYWRVKAKCQFGRSNFSSVYSFSTVKTETFTLKGYVSYNNESNEPINKVEISITGENNQKLTANTNKDGFFEIANLPKGNYSISYSKSGDWGGLNSADALLVAKSFVGLVTLDQLQSLSADVNNDSVINSSDALFIQRKFINSALPFQNGKPEWVFLIFENGIYINKINITSNTQVIIKALCTGDVNRSYFK